MANPTPVERTSERELVVTRTFDAPARIVFKAWTTSELMMRWWAPRSMGVPLSACEMDVRTGGGYRLDYAMEGGATHAFFGRYVEVTPPTRLVWTNDESEGAPVTTVTFEESGGVTRLTLHELYPSKEALDDAMGMDEVYAEQFGQLDDLLAGLGVGV